MVFDSSTSLDSFRLARHLSGQVVRPFSVCHSVGGGCLWPPHALLIGHLSQDKINIVDVVAAAVGALPVAGIPNTESGPQRRKPNVLHYSRATFFSLTLELSSCFMFRHVQLRP